ncbi:hypothetical protein GCM10023347_01510 [Streptomyces chumphonensis]
MTSAALIRTKAVSAPFNVDVSSCHDPWGRALGLGMSTACWRAVSCDAPRCFAAVTKKAAVLRPDERGNRQVLTRPAPGPLRAGTPVRVRPGGNEQADRAPARGT